MMFNLFYMEKKILLLTLFMFSFCSFLQAQDNAPKPIVKSNTKVNMEGKSVYIHKVEQGQTLYAISKAYNVLITAIEAENDSLKTGLKAGMELKIPSLGDKKSKSIAIKVLAAKFSTL